MNNSLPPSNRHPARYLVFFDWDNTLVDTWDLVHDSMQATLRELGEQEWTAEETKSRLGASLRDNFPRLFGERAEQARVLYREYFLSQHLERLRAFEGSQPLLADLFACDAVVAMAIVSNKTGSSLRAEVAQLGWQKYFQTVLGAEDCANDKPDPHCMAEALLQLGFPSIARDSVIYIGDSPVDMEFAQRTGTLGILLNSRAPDASFAKNFAKYPPMYQAHNFSELRLILTRLLGFRF